MGDQAGSTAAANAPRTAASQPASDTCRTALIIDGSYAHIGARKLPGGRIDFVKFREELERQAACRFRECWFFDQEPTRKSANQENAGAYTALKLAPPHGPQFQLKLYGMKKYSCHCRRCGHDFTQNVQKGVDNGIATKILSLAYENVCDRFILFAGDGDFYDSLNLIKNVLRKDLWVIGYRDTVSADLQQLATHVIWLNDLWPTVQLFSTQPQAGETTSSGSTTATSFVAERSAPVVIDESHLKDVGQATSSTRHVRLERQNPRSGWKTRTRTERRKERTQQTQKSQRSRSRSRSPAREATPALTLDEDGHPLFFVDTGVSRPDNHHEALDMTEPQRRAPLPTGRRMKRKRQDPPPSILFELSDMSSEEDEQHPGISHPRVTHNAEVIDLASDSE